MSLKKKIILGFLVSSIIISILVISSYTNFLEIRKEIQYLELSDTIRSKTLQLRRHEKNFLLYGDQKEIEGVHVYLKDLKTILSYGIANYDSGTLRTLEKKIGDYEQIFNRIEQICDNFQKELSELRPSLTQYDNFFRLIESTYMERPLVNAEIFTKVFL